MTSVSRYFFTVFLFAIGYDSSAHAMQAAIARSATKSGSRTGAAVSASVRRAAVVAHRPPPPVAPAPPVAHYDVVSASAPAGSDVSMVSVGAYSQVPPTVVPTAKAMPVVPSAPAGKSFGDIRYPVVVEGIPGGPPVAIALPAGVVADSPDGAMDRSLEGFAGLTIDDSRPEGVAVEIGETADLEDPDGKSEEKDDPDFIVKLAKRDREQLVEACKRFYGCLDAYDIMGVLRLLQQNITNDTFDAYIQNACRQRGTPTQVLFRRLIDTPIPGQKQQEFIIQLLRPLCPIASYYDKGFSGKRDFIARVQAFAENYPTHYAWKALHENSQKFVMNFIMYKSLSLFKPCRYFEKGLAFYILKFAIEGDNLFLVYLLMISGIVKPLWLYAGFREYGDRCEFETVFDKIKNERMAHLILNTVTSAEFGPDVYRWSSSVSGLVRQERAAAQAETARWKAEEKKAAAAAASTAGAPAAPRGVMAKIKSLF